MTRYEVVATVISFAAFAAAVIGIALGYSANKRSHATQKQLYDLEQARERDRVSDRGRAEVRAKFAREPDRRWLEFYNEGQAVAKQIEITVGGAPIANDPRLMFRNRAFETLGPGAVTRIAATRALNVDPLYRLVITWQDDSELEQPRSWESDLNG